MCVKCFIALTRRSAVRTIIEPNFPLNSLYLEKIVSKINSTTFYVARLNEHWAQNILTQVKHFIDQLFFPAMPRSRSKYGRAVGRRLERDVPQRRHHNVRNDDARDV